LLKLLEELQYSENPSQTNGDNVNSVRRETNMDFRKKEYLRIVN